MLENSSGSKFPVWLAGASFITEKKISQWLDLPETGKHQSLLSDDLKVWEHFWEPSSIRSNVPKASVFSKPTSECILWVLSNRAGRPGCSALCTHSICISSRTWHHLKTTSTSELRLLRAPPASLIPVFRPASTAPLWEPAAWYEYGKATPP